MGLSSGLSLSHPLSDLAGALVVQTLLDPLKETSVPTPFGRLSGIGGRERERERERRVWCQGCLWAEEPLQMVHLPLEAADLDAGSEACAY